MLDPEVPDERRDAIASDARGRIEGAGALKADNGWGVRKLAYEIKRRNEADYRFFRFAAGESALLDDLNHSLRITDGVLRFRLFKVDAESPVIEPPPPMALAASAPSRGPGGRRPGRGRDDYEDRGSPPPQPSAPAEAPAADAAPAAAAAEAAPAATEAPAPAEAAPEAPAPAEAAAPADSEAPAEAEPAAQAPPSADDEQPAS